MRKQYHFHASPRGILAWDVERLIRLAAELAPRPVPVAAIRELDEVYWFDAQHPPTCRSVLEHLRLVEQADLAHPILLAADGRVMDGMHRVAKAWLAGRSHVDAVQFDVDPEPDYVGRGPKDVPY